MKELNDSTIHRRRLPVRILQFGDGNFLRGFVDWMVEKSNQQGVTNLGIAIVQPRSKEFSILMREQNCLYHVYLEGIKDGKALKDITLVQAVQDIINPYLEYGKYEDLFLSPDLELVVSNTTEAGIVYQENDDLWALPPNSFPAKMAALLYKRFLKYEGASDKGLHVVCTELIENNGATLKCCIIQHAERYKLSDFIKWLNEHCYFYDTLVDRIVSGFPKNNAEETKLELGYNDNLIVKGEYFHVWAIGGNPRIKDILPLDKAKLNVLFMDDISSFRDRKVRILNGLHTGMVSVAILLGKHTVVDAVNDPLIEKYVRSMVINEILPVIKGNKVELEHFANEILERFYNPEIQHFLKDISLNSLSKWQVRNLPTLSDNLLQGRIPQLTIFSFATLLALYSGHSGVEFLVTDSLLSVKMIQETYDPQHLSQWVQNIIDNKHIWETDMSCLNGLVPQISRSVEVILTKGIEVALNDVLALNE